jgi:hypothetical protein
MRTSYGVIWQNGGTLNAGKLELAPGAVRLEGTSPEGAVVYELPYHDLAGVHIARGGAERLENRPTLVLEQVDGAALRVASVAQSGIVAELAEKIASIQLGAVAGARRVVIVVPIKAESRGAVQALVEQGPPFDPELMALERHDVYVTDAEAVFVFEGADSTHVVDRIVAQPGLWRGALAWQEYVAGPPRVAQATYAWSHDQLD